MTEYVFIGEMLVSSEQIIPNNPRGCLVNSVATVGYKIEYTWQGGRFYSVDRSDFVLNTPSNRVVLDKIFRLREAAKLNEEIAEELLESITVDSI